MKRTLFFIVLIVIVTFRFSHAQEMQVYNVIESESNIVYGDKKLSFESQPLLINSRIYVSIRELAEKLGMSVVWNAEENEAQLLQVALKSENRLLNENFGIDLSDESKVLNLDYSTKNGELHIHSKVLISENDLEKLKERKQDFVIPVENHSSEIQNMYNTVLQNHSNSFDWWTLDDIRETEFFYETCTTGNFVKTVWLSGMVTFSDNSYYLYLSRG